MFQRILIGLDGSPSGRQAFQAALELARLYRASLVALSVVEGPLTGNHETEAGESFDYYQRLQDNAVEQAKAASLTLERAMRRGHAARALVEFAQECHADLIVIGATGHEHPWSLQQLHGLLVHAEDRNGRIVRLFIGFQHFLHVGDEFAVGFWRNHPILDFPLRHAIFFSVRRTVS